MIAALTAATALIGVPVAGAALGDNSPLGFLSQPVSEYVYNQALDALCFYSFDDAGGGFSEVFVCASTGVAQESYATHASSDGPVTHVVVERYTCDDYYCDGDYAESDVPVGSLVIGPAQRSGRLQASVDGCAVDVSYTSDELPSAGRDDWQWTDPDHHVSAGIGFRAFTGTQGTATGTLCGSPLTPTSAEAVRGQGLGAYLEVNAVPGFRR